MIIHTIEYNIIQEVLAQTLADDFFLHGGEIIKEIYKSAYRNLFDNRCRELSALLVPYKRIYLYRSMDCWFLILSPNIKLRSQLNVTKFHKNKLKLSKLHIVKIRQHHGDHINTYQPKHIYQ